MDTRNPRKTRGKSHFASIAICCLLGSVGVFQILGNGGVIAWLRGPSDRRDRIQEPACPDPGESRRRAGAGGSRYGLWLYATRLLAFFFGAPPGEGHAVFRLEPCP